MSSTYGEGTTFCFNLREFENPSEALSDASIDDKETGNDSEDGENSEHIKNKLYVRSDRKLKPSSSIVQGQISSKAFESVESNTIKAKN